MSTLYREELIAACERGDVESLRRAAASGVALKTVVDTGYPYYSGTLLHIASRSGHLDIVKYLVDGGHCQPNSKNSAGDTALLEAASNGHLDVVQYLVDGGHCQPNSKNDYGITALHYAARNGHLDIVQYLVDGGHCQPNSKDNDGETALHYAVRYGRISVASYLLQHGECDPNSVTSYGRTPLDMTNNPTLIRILIFHGAKPTSRVPSHLRDTTADAATNMFIVGNPGAGKSTFIKSFSTSANAFTRIKHRFAKVTAVEEKTAGIIPCDIEIRGLGRVTAYDFAGHREFYAGHDALLQNSMRGSASIVSLLINMSEEESKIKEAMQYWVQFISNHTSKSGPNPHLVIIGSHAEGLSSREVKTKSNLMKSVVNSHNLCGITFAGQVITDCRFAESSSMSQLRSILSQSCQSIRSQEKISTAQHSLLVFLLDRFRYKAAVTYGPVSEALRESFSDEKYAYLECVKSSDPLELCDELSKRGNILFMKNQACLEKSWIVFDKASLLSQVNGVIFAPEGFKEHQDISTRSGLVPQSKLVSLFPNLNADMITQFLCHLEFCHEVTDEEVLSLLHNTESTSTEKERLLFFPGLVDLDIPADIWQPNDKFVYHSGWILKCSKPEQFFSSRFLQVLLLRLAYSLAFAPCTVVDRNLPRNIQVWKCGISWMSTSGIEVVVQVIDQKQVMVIIRGFNSSMTEFLRTRSAIIGKVLDAKQSLCPAVEVEEKFLCPESIASYPFDVAAPSKAVRIDAVAQSVVEAGVAVVGESRKMLELNSLLYFEPYANHGLETLESLFRSDAPDQTTDPSIDSIIKRLHENIDRAMASLGLPSEEVSKLRHEICCPEPDIKGLRNRLDQHSVFSGRSPLDLCTNKIIRSTNTSATISSESHQSSSSKATIAAGLSQSKGAASLDDHQGAHTAGQIDTGSRPRLDQLQLMEDSSGKTIRIMEKVAPIWSSRFAPALGFDHSRIEIIEADYRHSAEEACRKMFTKWLDGEHDLRPPTWDTLVHSLMRVGLVDEARTLKDMIRH